MSNEKSWVEVETQKGKNDGEIIATYSQGRSRHIVFFPRYNMPDEVGKTVRVILVPMREDSRGRMMYRGNPAPDIKGELWTDNGDDSASLWETAIDWLGNATRVAKIGVQQYEKQEKIVDTDVSYQFNWGITLESSAATKTVVQTISHQIQSVNSDGSDLIWTEASKSKRSLPAENIKINSVEKRSQHHYIFPEDCASRHAVHYENNWTTLLRANFSSGSSDFQEQWGNLPLWLQNQIQNEFPICSCEKSRIETSDNTDGYQKCKICRTKEVCNRCGQQKKVKVIKDRLICDDCANYETWENWIRERLNSTLLGKIADQAKKMAQGNCLSKDEGQIVLNTTSPKSSSWEKWQEAPFYYFCEDGVYASHLSKTALEILGYINQATGNSFVDIYAWIMDKSFFEKTQIKFESDSPSISESGVDSIKEKLEKEEIVLGDWIRGSESNRIKLTDWIHNHESYDNSRDEKESKIYGIACNGLRTYKYDETMQKVSKHEANQSERRILAQAGKLWLDVEIDGTSRGRETVQVRAISPNGEIVEPIEKEGGRYGTYRYFYGDLPSNVLVLRHSDDNYAYRYTEQWQVCHLPENLTTEQIKSAKEFENNYRKFFKGPGTGFDLTTTKENIWCTEYTRDFSSWEIEKYDKMIENLPINVSRWETEYISEECIQPYTEVRAEIRTINSEHKKLREQLDDAQMLLDLTEEELENCYGYCETERYSRVAVCFEKDPQRGNLFGIVNVQNFQIQNRLSGEYESFCGAVRFVCNNHCSSWLNVPPQAGETWVCSWDKMIGKDKKYRPIVVANPQIKIDNFDAIKAEVERLEAEIAQIENPGLIKVQKQEAETLESFNDSNESEEFDKENALAKLRKAWGK